MKRAITITLLVLLVVAALPLLGAANAQGAPGVSVKSSFTLHKYGYATVNESVLFTNNATSSVQAPSLTFGYGNLSSYIVAFNFNGTGFTGSEGAGSSYTVSGATVPAGGSASYVLSALVNGIVSTQKNGSLQVLVLSMPSISSEVSRLVSSVTMPPQTSFNSPPSNLTAHLLGSNNTYSSVLTNLPPSRAVTSLRVVAPSSVEEFTPLHVYSAVRTITASSHGTPEVQEQLTFQNIGTVPLAQLFINLLAPDTTKVTIVTVTSNEPVLLNSFTTSVASGYINLASFVIGYPNNGVPAGANFTLTYKYPLGGSYYSTSGGQVNVKAPDAVPVNAFIGSYNVTMSLPQGARAVQTHTTTMTDANPWQTGTTAFSYTLSLGWGIDAGVPLAAVVFVLVLVGLFAAGTASATEEEDEEESTSSELASAMIAAFDEKTDLINSLWPEIDAEDPNAYDRAYFDGLRGRLDQFRNRALQRLNEVKQKSTTQKFSDVLNQIHTTEREVDRAAKDKLNLYQQYRLKQMRQDVYERLLPQYTKRLEKALNQLSDELHSVQREAKLL